MLTERARGRVARGERRMTNEIRAVRPRILVVDDDRAFLVSLQALLEDEGGYRVECAGSGSEALRILSERSGIRVVVSDLSMPRMDGIELTRLVRESWPGVEVIVMTAHGSVATAVQAMQQGAYQYLTKPVEPDELLLQVERALRLTTVRSNYRALAERMGDPAAGDVLVGSSAPMESLRATAAGLAEVDSTVLIRGETGTGKELVARLIHQAGPRSSQAFVVVNCTAIPRDLLESELFGHEKGAFTGATRARRGRIEEAEGGTLLLDEIGDMPLDLQPKILRFLQEHTLRRVGGSSDRHANVRIMAATHRNLETAMTEGVFRSDLFYRLNTIPLVVPPLRERLEDLSDLCDHLVAKVARRLRRQPLPVSDAALRELAGHSFPGNVRELENLLERAMVLGAVSGAVEITGGGLAVQRESEMTPTVPVVPLDGGFEKLGDLCQRMEADLIHRAIAAWPGLSNRELAERLSTNRRVLELRMKEHGIVKGKSTVDSRAACKDSTSK